MSKMKIAAVILGIIVVVGGVVAIKSGKVHDDVSYSPMGMKGWADTDKNAYFVQGQEIISFDGAITKSISTPNHSKYLILYEDKKLKAYNGGKNEEQLVADGVTELCGASNQGCFYMTESDNSL